MVVMTDVDAQDTLELAAADDQQPVEALTADGADPWGADIRSHAAGASSYSWIRPPRRSWRCTSVVSVGGSPRAIGASIESEARSSRAAVWPLAVVVAHVDVKHVLELAAADDEQPVEALAADAADPALDLGVRVRRLDRRADDLDVLAHEEGVEGSGELRIPVMDPLRNQV